MCEELCLRHNISPTDQPPRPTDSLLTPVYPHLISLLGGIFKWNLAEIESTQQGVYRIFMDFWHCLKTAAGHMFNQQVQ